MARPMLLIKPEVLEEMYDKFKDGVPVLKLMRIYNLVDALTPPTLAKLLKTVKQYYAMQDDEIRKDIGKSLYPNWIKTSEAIVAYQPSNWYYTGSFPIGKWVKREEV